MRLKSLIMENFRGYQHRVKIDFADLTAFIGKNDVGKSTILEALDIYFNESKAKMAADDVCKFSKSTIVRIGCVFDELPDELILDTSAETTLEDEFLLNNDGDFEVHKIWDCSLKTIKSKIVAIAKHPSSLSMADLLQLKQSDLKSRLRTLGISESEVEDLRINAFIRRAIWKSVGDDELALHETEIDLSKEDAKAIWDKIEKYLPIYELFKSDRSSSDSDNEVQDPMKLAVKEAIKSVETELESIKKEVEKKAVEVATRTLRKLQDMDKELANELTPKFSSEPNWTGFKLSLHGDDDIPINKRGSGVRRLILLNFFRAEAERKAEEEAKQQIIYAIEEPETSQHPNNQEMLVKALLELSEQENCQVIVTTHVPALAGLIPIGNLRYVTLDNTKNPIVQTGDAFGGDDVLEEIGKTLGVFPARNSVKVIVCVEGIHDVRFFYQISKILNLHDATLPNLETDNRTILVGVGGGNLKHWITYNYLRKLGIPEFHIYDRDATAAYQKYCNDVNSRPDSSQATLTTKRTIENYLHPDAIYDELGINVSFGDNDDVPSIVASKLERNWSTLSPKQQKKLADNCKHPLNNEVVAKMDYSRLSVSDKTGDIEGWLRAIAAFF